MKQVGAILVVLFAFSIFVNAQTSPDQNPVIFPDRVLLSNNWVASGTRMEFSFSSGNVQADHHLRTYFDFKGVRHEIRPHVAIFLCVQEAPTAKCTDSRTIFVPAQRDPYSIITVAEVNPTSWKTSVEIIEGKYGLIVKFTFVTEKGFREWRKAFRRAGLQLPRIIDAGTKRDAKVKFLEMGFVRDRKRR